MKHFEIIERLSRIHTLIQQENTGSPDKFATQLRISRRQLYHILEELRDYGAPVKYSRKHRTFLYIGDFNITLTKLHLTKISNNNGKRGENEK